MLRMPLVEPLPVTPSVMWEQRDDEQPANRRAVHLQEDGCALGGADLEVLVQSLSERFGSTVTTNDLLGAVSHVNTEGCAFGRGVGSLKFYERYHLTQLDGRVARPKNSFFVHRSVPFSAWLKAAAKSHTRNCQG